MVSRNDLRDRYRQIQERIAGAAERAGRRAQDVLMVAVTKNADPEQIRHLIELGHQDLGENRVQHLQQRVAMTEEFVARHRSLSSSKRTEVPELIRWHMIGHLQRNKVKAVVPLVKLIHSVDSLRLAEELEAQATRLDQEAECLIQVSPVGEASKGGIAAPAVSHLIDQMQTMFHLKVRGLMAMAPYSDDPEDARPAFEHTSELFHEICRQGTAGPAFNILSMGMSGDFEVAIECGANVVRIGRALFGEKEEAAAA
jgi:pyridoxal phosphate enzyme (YggS family)